MSKRQTHIWDNQLANEYNENHGRIGVGLCYKIIQTFGDNQYSHDFCNWIFEKRKSDKTWKLSFDDMCTQFKFNI